ncbi:unnamed protein product [Amoebophrya sp. A25]|nr:unnamed protein product [Amoebophrya sp. A25]|eukprot:GSA25T00012758001.1
MTPLVKTFMQLVQAFSAAFPEVVVKDVGETEGSDGDDGLDGLDDESDRRRSRRHRSSHTGSPIVKAAEQCLKERALRLPLGRDASTSNKDNPSPLGRARQLSCMIAEFYSRNRKLLRTGTTTSSSTTGPTTKSKTSSRTDIQFFTPPPFPSVSTLSLLEQRLQKGLFLDHVRNYAQIAFSDCASAFWNGPLLQRARGHSFHLTLEKTAMVVLQLISRSIRVPVDHILCAVGGLAYYRATLSYAKWQRKRFIYNRQVEECPKPPRITESKMEAENSIITSTTAGKISSNGSIKKIDDVHDDHRNVTTNAAVLSTSDGHLSTDRGASGRKDQNQKSPISASSKSDTSRTYTSSKYKREGTASDHSAPDRLRKKKRENVRTEEQEQNDLEVLREPKTVAVEATASETYAVVEEESSTHDVEAKKEESQLPEDNYKDNKKDDHNKKGEMKPPPRRKIDYNYAGTPHPKQRGDYVTYWVQPLEDYLKHAITSENFQERLADVYLQKGRNNFFPKTIPRICPSRSILLGIIPFRILVPNRDGRNEEEMVGNVVVDRTFEINVQRQSCFGAVTSLSNIMRQREWRAPAGSDPWLAQRIGMNIRPAVREAYPGVSQVIEYQKIQPNEDQSRRGKNLDVPMDAFVDEHDTGEWTYGFGLQEHTCAPGFALAVHFFDLLQTLATNPFRPV